MVQCALKGFIWSCIAFFGSCSYWNIGKLQTGVLGPFQDRKKGPLQVANDPRRDDPVKLL